MESSDWLLICNASPVSNGSGKTLEDFNDEEKPDMSTASSSALPPPTDSDSSLVFAPNVPSPKIIHRPHLYEDVMKHEGESQDTPTLVWDDDLVPPGERNQATGFAGSKKVPNIPKPSSVSDEDYQKRLERLDHHSYGELDIPVWPGQEPVLLSPNKTTDIKKVVRDSWLPKESNDHDLPEGWKKEINEQGQEFYWHLATGKIQYVRPVVGGAHLRNSKVL